MVGEEEEGGGEEGEEGEGEVVAGERHFVSIFGGQVVFSCPCFMIYDQDYIFLKGLFTIFFSIVQISYFG